MCHILTFLYAVKLWIFHGIDTFSAVSLLWFLTSSGILLKLHCISCVSVLWMFDSSLILNNHKLSCGLRFKKWQNAAHIAAEIVNKTVTSKCVNNSLLCHSTRSFFLKANSLICRLLVPNPQVVCSYYILAVKHYDGGIKTFFLKQKDNSTAFIFPDKGCIPALVISM